ncbi:MAG: DUF1122 family protein [Candidatus Methylomirabilales bacterium]
MAKGELEKGHPLLRLQGRSVKDYTLEIEAWSGRLVSQAQFVLHLRDAGGGRSDSPVAQGLYGRTKIPGSKGEVERGILDVVLTPVVAFGSRGVSFQGSVLQHEIVGAMSHTIQDAWSAMMYLAYGWKTLKQIQELRHPVQVTEEGFLLFTHGFRGGWKDYYYSEGWMEGPIKLKAERPPTEEYRQAWDAENTHVLLDFLKRPPADGLMQFREEGSDGMVEVSILTLERIARSRALLILPRLSPAEADLLDEMHRVLAIYPAPEAVAELSAEALQAFALQATERK